MATNPFFNNFNANNEQSLHSQLVAEAIQVRGYDFYYLTRTLTNFDDLYNQDDMSEFNDAYVLEMYIKNIDAFGGEGTFLSKFGLEVRDRITFTMSSARFTEEIGVPADIPRPREGDLIYFPMTHKMFEIIQVDPRASFYPLGALPMLDIECEVFEYNNEKFNTGIVAIDALQDKFATDVNDYPTLDGNNDPVFDDSGMIEPTFDVEEQDPEFDNYYIQAEANGVIDLTILDPISKGNI